MSNSRDLAVAAEKQKRVVLYLAAASLLLIDEKEERVKQDVEKQYAPKKKTTRTVWVKD